MQNLQLPGQLKMTVKYCYTCGLPVFYKTRQVCCNHRCLDKYLFALNLAKSIVEFLHAGHALLRNTGHKLILDILPKDTTTVSRFLWASNKGITQDLLDMVHCISEEWYAYKKYFKTREDVTFLLLDKHEDTAIDSASLRPTPDLQEPKSTDSPIPKLYWGETQALRRLGITKNTLMVKDAEDQLKSVYKRLAKIHHPDAGGSKNKFIIIHDAYENLKGFLKRRENQKYQECPSEMYHPPHYVARQRERKRKHAGYKRIEVSLPLHYDAGQREWRHKE